jgi:hypothetical protein
MEGIEELIELFRKSGGKFENIALGYREESGYYCYTLDRNQNTIVSCPAHFLVDVDDVGISQDGLFIANPEKYGNNMEFLEKYIAFHFNRKMLDRYIEKKRQIESLSSRDLSLISRIQLPELHFSRKYGDLEFAKYLMLRSHKIEYHEKEVLMPFVTFLDHSKNGRPYELKKDAISVSGKFSDEVFAVYNTGDALTFASAHGFITESRFAFSIPIMKVIPNRTRVSIYRKIFESIKTREGFLLPLVHKGRDIVTISWFPLYIEGDPEYPARVARMVAHETGQSAESILYEVFHINLKVLLPAAFQLRESDNPYAQLIAIAAQRQLEVIGGNRK